MMVSGATGNTEPPAAVPGGILTGDEQPRALWALYRQHVKTFWQFDPCTQRTIIILHAHTNYDIAKWHFDQQFYFALGMPLAAAGVDCDCIRCRRLNLLLRSLP